MIHSKIRKIQPSRTIHYAPSIIEATLSGCIDFIKKGVFSRRDSSATLTLTNREKKYLLHQLKASKNVSWPDHLFPESKLTSSDSMQTTLNRLNRAIHDSVLKLSENIHWGKTAFLRYWGFWFSRPVYLRDKSILICYFMWYHSSAGENGLHVYRKEGDTYKFWMYGCGGAW